MTLVLRYKAQTTVPVEVEGDISAPPRQGKRGLTTSLCSGRAGPLLHRAGHARAMEKTQRKAPTVSPGMILNSLDLCWEREGGHIRIRDVRLGLRLQPHYVERLDTA